MKHVTSLSLLFFGALCCYKSHAQIITTIAGCPTCSLGDGGPATAANIQFGGALAFDNSGSIYVFAGARIRKVNASTGIITTYAGNGSYGYTGDGGAATAARITLGWLTFDNANNLYITQQIDHVIRKINVSTGIISTIAGTGAAFSSGNGGPASAASFAGPGGIAIDPTGNIFISDSNRVRKIDAVTGIITHYAGTGIASYGGDGGPATLAQFTSTDLSIDASGNLYINDAGNFRVRKVNTAGVITTVAGNGTFTFGSDGIPATSTGFDNFASAKVDPSGNIFIADYVNNRVRKVDLSGIIHTVAGTGVGGFTGDGGPATAAQLDEPEVVAIGTCDGNLYVNDKVNRRVRKIAFTPYPATCTCSPTVSVIVASNDTVCAGISVTFIATVSLGGTTHTYQWYKNGVVVSTAGSTYTYTPANGDSVRCVATTIGGACPTATWTNSNSIKMTVVSVAPITGIASICVGQTTTLTSATAGGIWSSSNVTIASVGSSTGVVTGHVAGTATITYTIPMGCYATQTITVNALPGATAIYFAPDSSSFCPGEFIGLYASVPGGAWSIVNGNALLAGSTLTAVTPGTDTVVYIVSNACGTDTASRGFVILPLPPVPYGDLSVCIGDTTMLKDSLLGGTWSGGLPIVQIYSHGDSCVVAGKIAGIATISYTSVNGCSSMVQVTVNPLPDAGVITGQNILCIGGHTTLTNNAGSGTWGSSDTGTATIGANGYITAKDTGVTYITYTVPPNVYGCIAVDTFMFHVIPPNFTVSGIVTFVQCYGDSTGKIELNKLGANIASSYIWSTGATTPVVQNLASGTYTVTVTDTNTNCATTETFAVTQPSTLSATFETAADMCEMKTGSILAILSGGISPYKYLWSNHTTASEAKDLSAGTYSVTATDANNCSKAYTVTVGDSCVSIIIRNGFSPNGDGNNDTWIIEGIEGFPANKVQVFDKWGDLVYEKDGYKNEWDGMGRAGTPLPDGTFYYLVKLNTSYVIGGKDTYTGHLLIKR
ncbi:MAG: hypothetical protein K0Q79_3177 [Flavipsychrobacter sp.]|jgi:gliding motility-associated-like protein|nr:hypothetical protein [Flavipsychrobacter sp.]